MNRAARLLLFGGFDADARDWAARVSANGGSVSATTQRAVSDFCKATKSAGIWTKLNRVNLFCGNAGNLNACLVPLKVGGGSATDTNVNFVSGDYTEATGITGNGTSKYLDTGLLASSLTTNDTHLSVYNRSSSSGGGASHIGCSNAADTTRLHMHAPFTSDVFYSDQYNTGSGRLNSGSAIGKPYGLLIGTRTASNIHTIYRNGASLATNATTGGSLPAASIFVFALDTNGAPVTLTNSTLGGYSIGAGLTAADTANYYTAMQAFQAALARSV